MSRITHMCMDVQGFLQNSKFPRDFQCMFKHDDGTSMDAHEARDELFNQLRMGRRVIPMGPCEGFDYQTGCPGHETATPDASSIQQKEK